MWHNRCTMHQDLREQMEKTLQHRYSACMFDFDGTLIERGYHMPVPTYISEILQKVSREVPMALCTTRPFADAIKHAHELFGVYFEEMKPRWTWFCESGSAGYSFDESTNSFVELYRVPWPQNLTDRTHFEMLIRETFPENLPTMTVHESVIILRPNGYERMSAEAMNEAASELQKKGLALLRDHGLDDVIRLGNSSLGVFFFCPEGDKNRGTLEFGKLLRSRGFDLGDELREIILFGDRPMPFGNDEHFLNGELGTPVNVGELQIDRNNLTSVIDDVGERLMGPRATEYLLRKLRFKTAFKNM